MKTIFKNTITVLLLFVGFFLGFSQNHLKMPENTVFYMEINGNTLNNKVNWEKFNPILQEVSKKNKQKYNWNDYSKTGIKYDAKQYHYATYNDSIKAYTAHFVLDNQQKFMDFINSSKKEGLEITKKDKFSYVDLGDNAFVAWNGNRAALTYISYSKPYKDIWENVAIADSTAIDSAALAVDRAAAKVLDSAVVAVVPEAEAKEEPFDYKEEIKYLKEDIKYLKESIKENQSEIARILKDIKYLEKHHRYPEGKEEVKEPIYDEETEFAPPPPPATSKKHEEEYDEEEDTVEVYDDSEFKKELDSIRVAEFKIVKGIAENSFVQYFDSDFQLEATKEMLTHRDEKSDVFVYTDLGSILSDGIYNKFYGGFYNYQKFFGKMYNSSASYNLYFDKDKVRMVSNYLHKDPETQKYISEIYKTKRNKKLASLISDNSIGYYAMNVNGAKYFDLIYNFFKDQNNEDEQKEIDVMVETMKIVLDEKEIAKIAPGNAIFVLNNLKTQKVEYTDYEYDEDYNSKEVKKTKEEPVPDFTFAFVTENENYWNKVFDMIANNRHLSNSFTKTGNIYSLKQEKEQLVSKLFFTVKEGVVYCSTSIDNIFNQNQSDATKKLAKESYKHAQSAKLDIQKLLVSLDKEIQSSKDKKDREIFNFLKKNIGTIHYKTDAKKDSIETEVDYLIHDNSSSENSLMYFFYLFDELYKLDNPLKDVEKVF